MMRFILMLSVCIVHINADCPDSDELPTQYSSRSYLCARVYEHSHQRKHLSCFGRYHDIYNGERTRYVGDSWNNRVSSLVVKDGCKLNTYWRGSYTGKYRWFKGKHYRLKNFGWNDEISSWTCYCDFSNEPLRCTPTEAYEQIAACENPNPGKATCTHSLQYGLFIGRSVTKGKTLSTSEQSTVRSSFGQAFSVELAHSTVTGYSWSTTDSFTFREVRTTTVSCEVPEGRTVRIKQVVGRCGDSAVYTSHYICE